jgi:DnaJ family protein C protein 7
MRGRFISNQNRTSISISSSLSKKLFSSPTVARGRQHQLFHIWHFLFGTSRAYSFLKPVRQLRMGFDVQHVLSDERHHGSFLCVICTNLAGLDALVTTSCSHVFCRLCLETWMERQQQGRSSCCCPTCNAVISPGPGGAQALQTAQPVAYRVLSRIQVACPLKHVHCSWRGEYGDLQTHLLSKTAHTRTATGGGTNNVETVMEDEVHDDNDEEMTTTIDLAKSFKEEANAKFASNNFRDARELYSKGVDVLNDDDNDTKQLKATLYANRAAAAWQLHDYVACVDDCQTTLILDPTYTKAYTRRYKAQLELGRFEQAVQGLQQGCNAAPSSSLLQRELKEATFIRDSFVKAQQLLKPNESTSKISPNGNTNHEAAATAQQLLSSLLQHHTKAPCVVVAAARAHLQLGGLETAQRLSLQVLRQHPQSFPEAYLVRGHGVFLLGDDMDMGLKVMREGLRLDPDSSEAKALLRACKTVLKSILEARQCVFHRQFTEAVDAFGRALEELSENGCMTIAKTPLYAKLHSERAEAHLRLKNYEAALQDASKAIYARDDLEQAWLVKAKAYHGLGRHEDAREELADLLQNKWGANHESIRKAYERADFLLRRQQRPDFYSILGVSSIASLMEIKKQYKVKAMEYHPDKWMSASPQQQKEAESNFKLLGQGLEVLSDDFQRQLYDEGYDPAAIRERVAAAQQAAHQSQNRGHHGFHGGHGGGGGHHRH